MAESSKSSSDKTNNDASNNPQLSTGYRVPPEEIHAMFEEARAVTHNPPAVPTYSSVSPAVAMAALLDIEEEGMREELADPDNTQEERTQIRQQLEVIQMHRETQRRWQEMTRTLEPPAAPSTTGKEPSR